MRRGLFRISGSAGAWVLIIPCTLSLCILGTYALSPHLFTLARAEGSVRVTGVRDDLKVQRALDLWNQEVKGNAASLGIESGLDKPLADRKCTIAARLWLAQMTRLTSSEQNEFWRQASVAGKGVRALDSHTHEYEEYLNKKYKHP